MQWKKEQKNDKYFHEKFVPLLKTKTVTVKIF